MSLDKAVDLAQQIVSDFQMKKRQNSKNRYSSQKAKDEKPKYREIKSASKNPYFNKKKASHPTKYSPRFNINLDNSFKRASEDQDKMNSSRVPDSMSSEDRLPIRFVSK